MALTIDERLLQKKYAVLKAKREEKRKPVNIERVSEDPEECRQRKIAAALEAFKATQARQGILEPTEQDPIRPTDTREFATSQPANGVSSKASQPRSLADQLDSDSDEGPPEPTHPQRQSQLGSRTTSDTHHSDSSKHVIRKRPGLVLKGRSTAADTAKQTLSAQRPNSNPASESVPVKQHVPSISKRPRSHAEVPPPASYDYPIDSPADFPPVSAPEASRPAIVHPAPIIRRAKQYKPEGDQSKERYPVQGTASAGNGRIPARGQNSVRTGGGTGAHSSGSRSAEDGRDSAVNDGYRVQQGDRFESGNTRQTSGVNARSWKHTDQDDSGWQGGSDGDGVPSQQPTSHHQSSKVAAKEEIVYDDI